MWLTDAPPSTQSASTAARPSRHARASAAPRRRISSSSTTTTAPSLAGLRPLTTALPSRPPPEVPTMGAAPTELVLRVDAGPGADDGELAELAFRLRDDLQQLDDLSVRLAPGESPEPGAKAGDP